MFDAAGKLTSQTFSSRAADATGKWAATPGTVAGKIVVFKLSDACTFQIATQNKSTGYAFMARSKSSMTLGYAPANGGKLAGGNSAEAIILEKISSSQAIAASTFRWS